MPDVPVDPRRAVHADGLPLVESDSAHTTGAR